MNEIFDIVDLKDRRIGSASRQRVHHEGLFHRAVHILVMRGPDRWVLQQRSMTKDLDPFLWTSSCSGHVDANESYLNAAVRECREELGLVVKAKSLTEVFRASPCLETGNEFIRVYLLKCHREIKFCREEIIQIKEFSIGEIKYSIKQMPEIYSLSFKHIFSFLSLVLQSHKSSLS